RKDRKDQAKFGEPVPVSDGELLVAPSGRPGPCQAIRLGGSGDVTGTHVMWTVRRKSRDVSSQILWQGLLYAADTKGVLTCYDVKTGGVVYSERVAPDAKSLASPVAVRGKLLFLFDNGETVVVEPGHKLQVLARNVLGTGATLDFE